MAARCLACHEILESESRYHPRCLNRLFGSARLPKIAFSLAELPSLLMRTSPRMSISGVQMKASVRLNRETWELEPVAVGGTHILKPEPDHFPQIPQNENLCMNMADQLGLPVPPHGLFSMADGKLCYVIKRFDRSEDGQKVQKETFFQILASTDKYFGSLEKIGKAIHTHASEVGLAAIDFFERVLFCFLTGNGDMHLKNWACLIQGRRISLAPCYDLVCSKIYIPNEDDSALTISEKKNKLKRSDFEFLANYLKIDAKAAAHVFEKLRNHEPKFKEMCANSELRADLRQKFDDAMGSRFKRLFQL